VTRTFYTDTVTRQRAQTSTDARNNVGPDWSLTPVSVTLTGCRVQPISSDEVMDNRYESDVRFRLLAPLGSDVTFLDRIVYGTTTYEVAGAPEPHRSPLGSANHDEIPLRRVSG
jgi:hypothetical protein